MLWKVKERSGYYTKGKERKGKERKGKERKGKESVAKNGVNVLKYTFKIALCNNNQNNINNKMVCILIFNKNVSGNEEVYLLWCVDEHTKSHFKYLIIILLIFIQYNIKVIIF